MDRELTNKVARCMQRVKLIMYEPQLYHISYCIPVQMFLCRELYCRPIHISFSHHWIFWIRYALEVHTVHRHVHLPVHVHVHLYMYKRTFMYILYGSDKLRCGLNYMYMVCSVNVMMSSLCCLCRYASASGPSRRPHPSQLPSEKTLPTQHTLLW